MTEESMPSQADQTKMIARIRSALHIGGNDTEYVAAFLLVMADVREKLGRDLTNQEAIEIGNEWRANAFLAAKKAQGLYQGNIPVLTTRYELAESVNKMRIFNPIVPIAKPTLEQIQDKARSDAFFAQQAAKMGAGVRRPAGGCAGILIALLVAIVLKPLRG